MFVLVLIAVFVATVNASTCGGTLKASDGSIRSPSFPDLYPLDKTCIWKIDMEVPNNKVPILKFTHFDLERANPLKECDSDRVEIFSRFSKGVAKSEGVFCGDETPSEIFPRSDQLRVVFTSDKSFARTGFALEFNSMLDRCSINNGNCRHGCHNTLHSTKCVCAYHLYNDGRDCQNGCNYEISSASGTITSPNYPDLYPSDTTCQWLFTTTPGHRINISINSFEVGSDSNCTYEYLRFYDGSSSEYNNLGEYCGRPTLIEPLISSNNEMYLVLKTINIRMKGFEATYTTICGGTFKASLTEKYIYSHPAFGTSNYTTGLDCKWTITAPGTHKIILSFPTFKIEQSDSCAYDYVKIYNGTTSDSPSLGKFCGDTIPETMSEESFLVHFHTDENRIDEGFSMKYQTVPV